MLEVLSTTLTKYVLVPHDPPPEQQDNHRLTAPGGLPIALEVPCHETQRLVEHCRGVRLWDSVRRGTTILFHQWECTFLMQNPFDNVKML